ncbi:MAG: helix-turn-helix domain-containing protein [Phycisphaerae bacterium]
MATSPLRQVARADTGPANRNESHSGPVLPGAPPQPCPELLTEEEAIRYLRLDTITGLSNPGETLARYRAQGMLRGTQVSKRVFYRRVELDRFLERVTAENPR